MRWLTAACVRRKARAAAVKLPVSAALEKVTRCGSWSALMQRKAKDRRGKSPAVFSTEFESGLFFLQPSAGPGYVLYRGTARVRGGSALGPFGSAKGDPGAVSKVRSLT